MKISKIAISYLNYRVEQAMTTKILKNINLENQSMFYKEIIDAVKLHRKAIKFCEFASSTFKNTFILLIITGVISLSLNVYGIFQNILKGDKEAFLLYLLLTFAVLLYMFVANYGGQEVINHDNHVYSTAYNNQWYNAPLYAQKLTLFILLQGSKTCNFNIGGLIVASLECFATLTKASMSYFTVIYSMQF